LCHVWLAKLAHNRGNKLAILRKSKTLLWTTILTIELAAFASPPKAVAKEFTSPDILILGDSQITFGSGPSFLSFFENLDASCSPQGADKSALSKLGAQSVAVIGVRSTSLGTWTQRSSTGKAAICDVDVKWKVNAGSYGTVNRSDNAYIQIGQGDNYQFCQKNKSAFEAMFSEGYYKPKLLLLTFLGNSSQTWAKDRNAALADVKAAVAQLPKDMPCVFITTAPPYQKKAMSERLKAQESLKWAFAQTDNRCALVDGYTPKTIAANLGNKKHFMLKQNGEVKDPFHPNKRGAQKFFNLRKDAICKAVFSQLR
jgi:hypothetical protein